MNMLLYWLVRGLVAMLQALPLPLVAKFGRACGGLAFHLDGRHRRIVLKNLTQCFGAEKSPTEISLLAQENFRRIGENYTAAIKTSAMSADALRPHVEFTGFDRFPQKSGDTLLPNIVVAIGHFGNFELHARFNDLRADYQCVTTYRGFKQPWMNRLLRDLRSTSGCLYFERRSDGPLLRATMSRGGIILGLLADQNSKGLRAPFLGHDCNTGLAPAVLALRYEADLYSAICYRIAPAKWRLELGEIIPTRENGQPRSSEAIMRDVNLAFEAGVRRDPANWFWVHRRWKD